MNHELESKIKNIEQEILDLKTATKYSSLRSSSTIYSQPLSTGNYRVTYNNHGNEVIALFFTEDTQGYRHGPARALPLNGSTQTVQIDASYAIWNDAQVSRGDFTVILTIISNYPVVSIEAI